MSSIIIMDNEPKDCLNCKLHFHRIGVCAYTGQFTPDLCPMKPVGLMEEKIRPLSKEKFTKIYIEEQ